MKFMVSIFFVLLISACKSSVDKADVLNSQVEAPCKMGLAQGAPYSPKAFKEAIDSGLENAIKDPGNIDLLRDFLSNDHLNSLAQGEVPAIPYFETDPCAVTLQISQAAKGEVVELVSLVGPNSRQWGGLILFGEDLFSESNFEARTNQFAIPAEFKRNEFKDPLDFSKGSAWFKWTGHTFEFQKAGASRRILEILARTSPNLRLLRGAGLDSSSGEVILSFKNESTMFGKDPFSPYQGIFFHVVEKEAKKYANPLIAEIVASVEDLISLSSSEEASIFVGFSHGNIDVAILRNTRNPKTLALLSSLKPYCTVESLKDGLMLCP